MCLWNGIDLANSITTTTKVGWKVGTAAKGSAKAGDVGLKLSVNYEHNGIYKGNNQKRDNQVHLDISQFCMPAMVPLPSPPSPCPFSFTHSFVFSFVPRPFALY